MRRTLNYKALACLLVALLVCGGSVHLLHGFQVKRNARALLQLADQAEEAGKLDKAADYLSRYLLYDRFNGDVRTRYGLLLAKLARTPKQYEKAFYVLSRVLQKDDPRLDVHRAFVPVAMKVQRYQEALNSLRFLHHAAPEGPWLRMQAQCFEGLGTLENPPEPTDPEQRAVYWANPRSACEACEDAIEFQPDDAGLYLLDAHLLRDLLNQPTNADLVMDRLVEANRLVGAEASAAAKHRAASAYLTRGRYRLQYGATEAGTKDVQEAYKLDPTDADVLLAKAEVELGKTPPDFGKARAYLQASLKEHPHEPAAYQALARLEQQAGRRPQAIAALRQALKVVPADQRHDLVWDLAALLIQQKDGVDEARGLVQGDDFPEPYRDLLEARRLMAEEDWDQAAQKLEAVRPRLLPWPDQVTWTDRLLGQCYHEMGDWDRQYAAYRRLEKQDPTSRETCLGLGTALEALGKYDQALATYRRLYTPERGGDLATAVEEARLLILLSERPGADPRWDEAEAILASVDKTAPNLVQVPLYRAEILVRRGQVDAARKLLDNQLRLRPDEADLWVGRAAVEDMADQPQAARTILDDAQHQLGDRAEVRLARARYWAGRPAEDAAPALAALAQGIDDQHFSRPQQALLLRGLAQAFARVGDAAKSRELWGELAALRPHDLSPRLSLFDAAARAGDGPGMESAVAELKHMEGADGVLWRYGQACYLIWQAKNAWKAAADKNAEAGKAAPEAARKLPADVAAHCAEAGQLLEAVAARRPAWSRVPVKAAEIDLLRGDVAGAISNYQRAVNELGEQDPQVFRALVQLLDSQGRDAEVRAALQNLPPELSHDPAVLRVKADLSFRANDYDEARTLADKAVSPQSKNFSDQLWRGMVLARSPGQKAQAEAAFRQAVELADKDNKPRTWVYLIRFLADAGEKGRAAAALREAEAQIGKDPLALAPCYEAVGQADRAQELYDAAVVAKPDDLATLRAAAAFELRQGRTEKAQEHLQKIVDTPGISREDKAQIRNVFALLLAADGDYEHARKALGMLGLLDPENRPTLSSMSGSAADQRTQAVVLASRGTRKAREKAIATLEDLLAKEPPTPDDQFLLAQLYDLVGDWRKAHEQILALLPAHDGNLVYLSVLTRALLRHQEVDAAEPWVEKVRHLPAAAKTFVAAELEARLLAGRDQAGKAVTVLQEYVADPKAQPAKQGGRQILAAKLLEELSWTWRQEPCYTAAAEVLYRDYVKQHPDGILLLADFLGRNGKLADALQVCERALQPTEPAKAVPAEAVGVTADVALQAGHPDDRQYRLVEGWLETAIAKNPKSTRLVVCRAFLRDLEGRHDEAAALYRQALERNGKEALALNNLALLLALRDKSKSGEALGLINRAIESAGPLPELRDTRAVVFLASGQVDNAIKELEGVVGDRPLAASYFHLVQAYLRAGKTQEARDSWQKARANGLTPGQLHPLERAHYDELVAQFGT